MNETLSFRPAFTRPGAEPVPIPAETALPDNALTRPWLDYDVRRGIWYLAAPYTLAHEGHVLVIPEGFNLNLASVPRPLWWLIGSFELGLIGPLVHDATYHWGGCFPADQIQPYRTFTRKEADDLFADILAREGVRRMVRMAAYTAVRLFGWASWRNRKKVADAT